MKLTSAQNDRAAGLILGTAAGDALGAGYEFGPPLSDDTDVTMKGGGGFGWAPGEWTDDTSMAVPILRMVAAGRDLREEAVLDEIVAQWVDWAKKAPDVGIQLGAILRRTEPTASAIRVVAKAHHDRTGRSAGNGSLMRTAPVVLGYLDDPTGLAEAARLVSDLTHFETDAGDACVLWCLTMRHAVLHGEIDIRVGLDALPAARRDRWAGLIAEAETLPPSAFPKNGWVVQAVQGAWSAISRTDQTDASHLRLALEAAVRGGRDTDTVAAIAGGLLGARWGVSAVPAEWRRVIHGWPELRGGDLVRLAGEAVRARGLDRLDHRGGGLDRLDHRGLNHRGEARVDYSSWGDVSALVRHPHDDGVWLGAVGSLDALPAEIDAVVSLCRVGTAQIPDRIHAENRVAVWLIDQAGAGENPNLDFVFADTVDAIAALRAERRTVLVHCVQAMSRTPTIAALYAARHRGVPIDRALRDVMGALPRANPNRAFCDAMQRPSVSGLS
ncbi:ADP-ribosyl-[dinitrogen reductase] hydrolase [Cryobacterium sp. CAN_C3]|uniref:ADP-ribosylglycohydrolase family protein n=1 Tax=unclassified Cryobacterium TaxID=2649013 RepID=UPI0018CA7E17|nr:ADP-ribosylglycohydrolase family protein [Cryobacterium sp. CAN_C3]MEC5152678.1 ADP-ribosyl-[dinitrogen reductase] hydrolase [Cryobacterium sp. CAN_C3]